MSLPGGRAGVQSPLCTVGTAWGQRDLHGAGGRRQVESLREQVTETSVARSAQTGHREIHTEAFPWCQAGAAVLVSALAQSRGEVNQKSWLLT